MSNGLEHGYYLEMKTGCEHDATTIYIGPYAGRSEAEEESDFLVNTPKGEKMLESFRVNSIKPVHSSDIDGPVVHALEMYPHGST